MRAAILTEIPSTELLVADDVELRPLEPGDVKIDVAHSGVCHSDLSTMNGTIPGSPRWFWVMKGQVWCPTWARA